MVGVVGELDGGEVGCGCVMVVALEWPEMVVGEAFGGALGGFVA
jgi:hypothetical protein